MQIFVASVFPAPDSPETRIARERRAVPGATGFASPRCAACATEKTCGSSLRNGSSHRWYFSAFSSAYRSSQRNGLTEMQICPHSVYGRPFSKRTERLETIVSGDSVVRLIMSSTPIAWSSVSDIVGRWRI